MALKHDIYHPQHVCCFLNCITTQQRHMH